MKVKLKVAQLCPTLCDPMDYTVHGIIQARILEWVAIPFSMGSCQHRDWTQVSRIAGRFLYQLSHQGSPRILEWVVYPFSRESSWSRNWNGVSCIAGGFFTSWAIRIHISPLLWISFPFRLLQSMEQSSLCCTGGFHYLSIFYIVSVACIYMSIPVSQFFPLPFPPWYPYVCSLRLCLFCIRSSIPFF